MIPYGVMFASCASYMPGHSVYRPRPPELRLSLTVKCLLYGSKRKALTEGRILVIDRSEKSVLAGHIVHDMGVGETHIQIIINNKIRNIPKFSNIFVTFF